MAMASKSIVVTGGSGYLGQLLIEALAKQGHKVALLHWRTQPPDLPGDITSYTVDLASGHGLEECFKSVGHIDVVVNCAAISSPAVCEDAPDEARALNIPTKLLDALDKYREASGKSPLLIHLSTDQVYDGTRAWWKEDEETRPVNAYGQSKLDAEKLIQARWPNHAILRSSLIYGPKGPAGVARSLFIQFVASVLEAGKPTTFFEDEFRCAVYSSDIIRVVEKLMEAGESLPQRVFNMGGPERLSRVDMAQRVAEAWGLDPKYIVPAPSSSIQRNVASPPDISMDISRIESVLGVQMTPMLEALKEFSPK